MYLWVTDRLCCCFLLRYVLALIWCLTMDVVVRACVDVRACGVRLFVCLFVLVRVNPLRRASRCVTALPRLLPPMTGSFFLISLVRSSLLQYSSLLFSASTVLLLYCSEYCSYYLCSLCSLSTLLLPRRSLCSVPASRFSKYSILTGTVWYVQLRA
jgi:hypothetical protein